VPLRSIIMLILFHLYKELTECNEVERIKRERNEGLTNCLGAPYVYWPYTNSCQNSPNISAGPLSVCDIVEYKHYIIRKYLIYTTQRQGSLQGPHDSIGSMVILASRPPSRSIICHSITAAINNIPMAIPSSIRVGMVYLRQGILLRR
jgi:hypothetical protein